MSKRVLAWPRVDHASYRGAQTGQYSRRYALASFTGGSCQAITGGACMNLSLYTLPPLAHRTCLVRAQY